LNRVAAGDRVRFFTDYYGVQYVELVPRWQFWRKQRIRLDASEAEILKSKLKTRTASN
jgi:hypothetical protein